jgi:hypothetical protein
MKLKSLRVANSILVGNKTETWFLNKDYDMTIDGVLIWIVCKKTGHKVFTSLFNVPYGEAELAESKPDTERVSKAKAK